MKSLNKHKAGSHFSLLVLALLFVACTANNVTDESSDSVTPSMPEVAVEPAAILLVTAKVRQIGGYDESIRIEVEQEPLEVPLPGLSFYAATPMVVDSLDDRCAVYGEEAWCFQEALQNIISQFSLGTNPEQLNNDEWLTLLVFLTNTTPLTGPDALSADAQSMPDSERAQISEPIVRQLESGGIEVYFYYEAGDIMGFGDASLNILNVTVSEDNVMQLEHREIWNNFDLEE